MTLYPFALFAHILGVLGMFIAIALEWTSLLGMRRARTLEQVRPWATLGVVPEKVFPFSGLLILGAGVYMALVGWGWQVAWIDVSLLALLLMFTLGPLINSRRLSRIHRAAGQAPAGAIPQALARQIEDPVLWTCVPTLNMMALGVVLLMTTKPGWPGSLGVVVVSVLLGLLSGSLTARWRGSAAVVAAQVQDTP
jgi:hypothetical protein